MENFLLPSHILLKVNVQVWDPEAVDGNSEFCQGFDYFVVPVLICNNLNSPGYMYSSEEYTNILLLLLYMSVNIGTNFFNMKMGQRCVSNEGLSSGIFGMQKMAKLEGQK